jgi:hypothetical protein
VARLNETPRPDNPAMELVRCFCWLCRVSLALNPAYVATRHRFIPLRHVTHQRQCCSLIMVVDMKDILNMVITTTDQNTISHTATMVVVMSGIIINLLK